MGGRYASAVAVGDGVPVAVYGADVIEIMTFRLRNTSDVEDFLATDRRVQTDVAYQCPGLLRRTIARNGDRWLVLQIWASADACADSADALATSTFFTTFMAFVDPSTVSVERFGDVGDVV